MIGSFLTRLLVMVFGYAYPAYECFKVVEKNKMDIEKLRFWCQYWILAAILTVLERVMDIFVSWIPMYSEAKLAFIIYLWYPKTKGTEYIYESFLRPYLAKHETEIDRSLLELRARCADITVMYWQKAATYGQTRIFEILQFIAAQSTLNRNSTQQQEPASSVKPAVVLPSRQPAPTLKEKPQKTLSHTKSAGTNKEESNPANDVAPSTVLPSLPARAGSPNKTQKPPLRTLSTPALMPVADPPTKDDSAESKQIETEETKIEEEEIVKAPPEEIEMEETIKATRVRLRKTRSTAMR